MQEGDPAGDTDVGRDFFSEMGEPREKFFFEGEDLIGPVAAEPT